MWIDEAIVTLSFEYDFNILNLMSSIICIFLSFDNDHVTLRSVFRTLYDCCVVITTNVG